MDTKISCPEQNSLAIRQWSLGYLGRRYTLRRQQVHPFSHCSIWLRYTASVITSFGPQKTKFELSTCAIKSLSDNINLKIPSILWQGNRASKIKRLLAGYDIHLPCQVLISYTSALPTVPTLYSQLQHGLCKRPTLSNSIKARYVACEQTLLSTKRAKERL